MRVSTRLDCSDAKDLLLEDYRYRAETLRESEKAGETRVNVFVVLMTLVSTALVTLVTNEKRLAAGLELWIVVGGLGALLAFGWLTLQRLIKRNQSTDECKLALDLIRQKFKDHFDDGRVLLGYYPVNWPEFGGEEAHSQDKKRTFPWQMRSSGGLAHLVAVINAILLGGIVFAVVWRSNLQLPFVLLTAFCLVVILVAAVWQIAHIGRKEEEHLAMIAAQLPTHAGGVVVKPGPEGDEYLLVSAKDEKDQLVLPKGHIERGEGHGEAALREVREESGEVAELLCLLGQWKYSVQGKGERESKPVRLKVYLMSWKGSAATKEKRSPHFYPLTMALQPGGPEKGKDLLPETKEILKTAAQVMLRFKSEQ